jgi:hypothetical protein
MSIDESTACHRYGHPLALAPLCAMASDSVCECEIDQPATTEFVRLTVEDDSDTAFDLISR